MSDSIFLGGNPPFQPTANVTGVNFTSTAAPTTFSISGTITPTSGGSGATVILSGAAGATTTTNASGAYTFNGVANGNYTVDLSALTGGLITSSLAITDSAGNTACANGNSVYSTIQSAINAASSGDKIGIAAGTYNENVVVNKNGLSVIGAGDTTIIHGTFKSDNGIADGQVATFLESGHAYVSDEEAAKRPPNALADNLRASLEKGPIKFRLLVQLAAADDPITDATKIWPDSRPTVELGEIAVIKALDTKKVENELLFLPTNVTSGIDPSDDPIINTRTEAYAESFGRRTK